MQTKCVRMCALLLLDRFLAKEGKQITKDTTTSKRERRKKSFHIWNDAKQNRNVQSVFTSHISVCTMSAYLSTATLHHCTDIRHRVRKKRHNEKFSAKKQTAITILNNSQLCCWFCISQIKVNFKWKNTTKWRQQEMWKREVITTTTAKRSKFDPFHCRPLLAGGRRCCCNILRLQTNKYTNSLEMIARYRCSICMYVCACVHSLCNTKKSHLFIIGPSFYPP